MYKFNSVSIPKVSSIAQSHAYYINTAFCPHKLAILLGSVMGCIYTGKISSLDSQVYSYICTIIIMIFHNNNHCCGNNSLHNQNSEAEFFSSGNFDKTQCDHVQNISAILHKAY